MEPNRPMPKAEVDFMISMIHQEAITDASMASVSQFMSVESVQKFFTQKYPELPMPEKKKKCRDVIRTRMRALKF